MYISLTFVLHALILSPYTSLDLWCLTWPLIFQSITFLSWLETHTCLISIVSNTISLRIVFFYSHASSPLFFWAELFRKTPHLFKSLLQSVSLIGFGTTSVVDPHTLTIKKCCLVANCWEKYLSAVPTLS